MSIKIENIDVYGWEAAIRGMRNPKNSWDMSDSGLKVMNADDVEFGYEPHYEYVIGANDLKLMHTLAKAGPDHGKFLRMITVTMDITAPLYLWKEFDTYKVGTVANSCSTMHKIHAKEFTLDDFSHEHLSYEKEDATELLDANGGDTNIIVTPQSWLNVTITLLNNYRLRFLQTKDKKWWWQMIQSLPSSYNQRRTVQMNYAVALNMYNARKSHKLDEWHVLCDEIKKLPYFEKICLED